MAMKKFKSVGFSLLILGILSTLPANANSNERMNPPQSLAETRQCVAPPGCYCEGVYIICTGTIHQN